MQFIGIWIKAIAFIIVAILVYICGFFAYKNLNWKAYEFAFVLVIGLVLIIMGIKNINYVVNPQIEKVEVEFIYQSSYGVIFGREYHFEDSEGNIYNLTMDPITKRKIFKDKEFSKNSNYTITFEKKSETIIAIDNTG